MTVLAVLVVIILTHNLGYFFPVTSNYLNQVDYFVETTYNQFMGYRPPVNPDPMVHNMKGASLGILGLIGVIMISVLALFKVIA